jgi:hypothetical protein
MTHVEQHKMILALMDYTRKMGRYEQDDFEMMVKRDKDDEDLDTLTRKRLQAMYDRFIEHRAPTPPIQTPK